ncbi:MAG: hypothetical protein GY719_36350 [bacterium]|nr:hypothetical protein [bacterium]
MRKSKQFVYAMVSILLVASVMVVSISSAESGGCQWCEFIALPDPDGGPPSQEVACIDFDTDIGWWTCYELQNGCYVAGQCYWSWNPIDWF